MKMIFPFLAVGIFGFFGVRAASAQETAPAPAPDPQIASALRQISPERVQADIEKLVSFQTRLTISAQDPAAIAAGHGIGAAREWIKNEFERYSRDCGGCLEVKTDAFTQEPAERVPVPTEIINVYAVLRGTDPKSAARIVLVTGHYDSRNSDDLDTAGKAPGANDDASGTAVSLECTRVLSQLKFPATIIFLTVAGEEQGLNGSRHFAAMAKSAGWNIEAVLNNDIVGGNRNPLQDRSQARVFSEGLPDAASPDEIRLIRAIGGESDSPSRELARYIAETGRTYDTKVKAALRFRPDRYGRGGDHSSFNHEGFAAVRFTEYREDYSHQHQNVRTENGFEYGDLLKFVDFAYVADVARLNEATLASLASAPAPPGKVRLSIARQENQSALEWEASPDGRASGYEVIWRGTTSPEWEHAQAVGNLTRTTLSLSKDNVIFAVRAVDDKGHSSLPVVPLPER